MPASRQEQEFVAYVVDMMHMLGPVRARAMFGGHGIFRDGLMFALVADGVLYFKADEDSAAAFRERGLPPFTYTRKGKSTQMAYYQAPEETLENSEAMVSWARRACDVARRAAAAR